MVQNTLNPLSFGSVESTEAALSEQARTMVGSEILKIASDIRARVSAGEKVCNLTVGDFDSSQFPIPHMVLDGIKQALDQGHTNYPPSDGMLALRKAILTYVERTWGVRYPLESVCVASGARPVLYAAYRCVLDPGETALYPVPSWNNNHYTHLTSTNGVAIRTTAENAFMPTVEDLKPHISKARMLALNTPSNPTGTMITQSALQAIVDLILEENNRRKQAGERGLFLLFDQVYGSLVFSGEKHKLPTTLNPDIAPWTIAVDGVSKAFAGTGLRVGWVLAPPAVTKRMKDFIGHVGAWAPRAEQLAVANFLNDSKAVHNYQVEMNQRVQDRLEGLYAGFQAMKADGYPVDCINPQGAIYLSLRLDAIGKRFAGQTLDTNEGLRSVLLEEAGLAVVPFQAFGLEGDTGWFRMSVGAVSMQDIEDAFPRLRNLMDRFE